MTLNLKLPLKHNHKFKLKSSTFNNDHKIQTHKLFTVIGAVPMCLLIRELIMGQCA